MSNLTHKKYLAKFWFFCKNRQKKKIGKITSQQYFRNFSQERLGEQPLTLGNPIARAPMSPIIPPHAATDFKFPPREIPLKLLLNIQSSSNPHWSPGPGSFQDSSLPYTGGKSCPRRVVFHQDNLLNLLTFPKEPLSCRFGGRGIQTDGQSFHVWKG